MVRLEFCGGRKLSLAVAGLLWGMRGTWRRALVVQQFHVTHFLQIRYRKDGAWGISIQPSHYIRAWTVASFHQRADTYNFQQAAPNVESHQQKISMQIYTVSITNRHSNSSRTECTPSQRNCNLSESWDESNSERNIDDRPQSIVSPAMGMQANDREISRAVEKREACAHLREHTVVQKASDHGISRAHQIVVVNTSFSTC